MAEVTTVKNTASDTIGALLARNASSYGSEIAVREKERGIWKENTWAEYAEEVLACAAGLEKIGVEPGKAVLILGDNRARLYGGMLAISLLGAYAMPAYPGATIEELQHFLGEVEIVAAIAEDQEQVDKIIEVQAQLPDFERMVYLDPRGLRKYDHSKLDQYSAVQELGRANREKHIAELEARQAKLNYDSTGVMLYTSGTTGKPKGAVSS